MNNKKIILSLLAAFVLLSATPVFADWYSPYTPYYSDGYTSVSTGDTMYVVLCNESVSLRYLPSMDSAVICQVPLYDSVTFLGDVGNGYLHVDYNGYCGYILSSYLDYYEPQIAICQYGWIVNVNESASLRSLPSTDSPAYLQIPAGSLVTNICDINDRFYAVHYNGIKGYVLKSLVQLDYN